MGYASITIDHTFFLPLVSFYMNAYHIVLCTILSLGVLGTGVLLDYRNAESDRAARTTDYSNPNTLLTGRAKPRDEEANGKV